MSLSSIGFSRNLIKGKIAEVIFEQMIREEDNFTVIPLGYEQTLPTLAQYQHLATVQDVMKNLSDAPDFALVSNDKKEVYLVEVKYRENIDQQEVCKYAEKLLKRWKPSFLFVASFSDFYFSSCTAILRERHIGRLPESWVNSKLQSEYLELLKSFEKQN